MTEEEFLHKKIYQNLEFYPKPESYNLSVPWIIQCNIASTNGKHYKNTLGKLKEVPAYHLPLPQVSGNKLMLDIGAGWGRWMIAASKKGYIPVGIDMKLAFCNTQQQLFRHHNVKGYSIVADLENIPFQKTIFDLVWSFSVLQHTHLSKLYKCLESINDVLTNEGYCYIELPNKNGIRNRLGPVRQESKRKDEIKSWKVRYYTPEEYRLFFDNHLANFKYEIHSFLGIGILKEDLKYVSIKNKLLCLASLLSTFLARTIPAAKRISDSIYIKANRKDKSTTNTELQNFLHLHHTKQFNNLHILPLLKCPKYGTPLELSKDGKKIISNDAGIYYPIVNNIPILVASESSRL